MNRVEIEEIVARQRDYFAGGKTLPVSTRIKYLKALAKAIKENMEPIQNALYKDLGKSASESYMCEIGLVLSEIHYLLKHIKKFTKPKRVRTPMAQYVSKSYQLAYPYGTVLILSPWNYPFLLALEPLAEALAAGNTVVLKTSEYAPYTSEVIFDLMAKVFPKEYITVIFGGIEENEVLITLKFDYVFFTGSKRVGQLVYESASRHLTPVTLELGGKSPCIVDRRVKLKLAARRIVWGKFLNCGQTCVAPDYILCHRAVHEEFVNALKKEIKKQFGEEPLQNKNYGKMINEKHFNRVSGLIEESKIVYGGKTDAARLQIEPTILDNVSYADKVMQEEIFGPVLPIIVYDDIGEVTRYIASKDAPLAFYVFSKNKKLVRHLLGTIGFGGGCVNDVVIHLATSYMSFGGYRESGMGAYHGRKGFETFTHYKSIVDKKTWLDLPMRYQPFKKFYDKLVKIFLR